MLILVFNSRTQPAHGRLEGQARVLTGKAKIHVFLTNLRNRKYLDLCTLLKVDFFVVYVPREGLLLCYLT